MSKTSAACTAAGGRGPSHDSEMTASHGFRARPAGEKNDRGPAIAQAVTRAKSGDNDAIRFLYLRYKDNVYGYVLSILRDAHDAEDVTQTVFHKAGLGDPQVRASPGSIHRLDSPGGAQRGHRFAAPAPSGALRRGDRELASR